ncbi:MAG TPA: DegT/DnrJ/EryC1/StrS family aminotransferase [Solirubrobacteraceae bacterium]|nr:DegT/DnrJ/EryC1/StrS family aminotransferase [Solirubrobacteraceae bacterium]
MGAPLRKSPGVPERRSRRGTAPIAGDRIPFQRPELPPAAAIMAHFERLAGAHLPCVRELAMRIEERLDHRALCVPVASATAGLMAALRALCGAPDARRRLVACPSYTFAATAGAIVWAGFEPLFVDVEAHGFGLDPASLDAALQARPGRVAGILACAPFGSAPAAAVREGWREVAARHGTPLLIDSAPGFGAVDDDGLALGAQGDTEVFSFHAESTFAVGEGGAVTTPDPELAARIARTVNYGIEPSSHTVTVPGFNGKLSELHAATGLAVLDRFDGILASRRRTAARIAHAADCAGLTYQRGSAGSPWQVFQAYAPDPAARERVLAAAAAGHVDARTLHDPPLHHHPAFASAERAASLEITEALAARSISLPLANDLTDDEIDRIAAVARAAAA